MKNMIWKRLIVAVCIVALLMNVPGMTVLADEVPSEEIDSSEIGDSISSDGSERNSESQIEISHEEMKQEYSDSEQIDDSKVSDNYSVVESDDSLNDVPNDIQGDAVKDNVESEIFASEDNQSEGLIGATSHTRDEAVAWANSQVGKSLDYDGKYGAQCVDFIYYYYIYWGQAVPGGSAYQFVNGGRYTPSGWSYQSSPLPGDIAVWTGGDNGHVAIVTEIRGSQMVCVEQNYRYVQKVTSNLHSIDAQTYIRPDFPPPPDPDIWGEEMTNGYDAVLPDGDYAIVNAADQSWYLDIMGGDSPAANGTNVNIWGPADDLASWDVWNITYSNGFYTIRQKDTDICLDVTGGDRRSGTNVQTWCNINTSGQKWAISRAWPGYRLQSKCSGFSLDLADGSLELGKNVRQWVGNDSLAQKWLFIPYEPARTIADGRYIMVSALNPNLILDIPGNTADVSSGTNVQVWNDSVSNKYNSVDVKYLEHGYYRLTHATSGLSFDVESYYPDSGTNIKLYTWGNQINQKWAITKSGDGYLIWSKCSGLVMDVADSGTEDGTNVRQCYRYNGSNAQIWKFVQAEYSVNYNANGGTGAPASQLKYYRNPLTLSSVKPTMSGSTFKGWSTSKSATTADYQAGSNYTADKDVTLYAVWEVQKKSLSDCTITLSQASYTYDGKAKKPTVTVKNDTEILTSGTDYTVSYSNNTNAGTATVTVTGTGNCIGTNSTTFKINKAAPKLTFASESVSKTISDDAFINELTKTTDGTVVLSSSDTNVATVNSTTGIVTIRGTGTATITVAASAGKNYKAGSASYTLDVSGISIENAAVGGVSLSYGYSGKAYTPVVTVKLDGVTLMKDTDYTVKYENNQNPGTATITVTGKGKYSGTKIKTFEIVDCVSSVVSGKTYLLIPKNNAKTAVCAYAGKMVNNTKIYITDRGNSESQKFKAVKNSDGTWKFINAKCELALAVQQNSSELGAGLVLYDQTTKPAQNWKLSKKADNSFAIINSVTGYSIAMSDKSAVKGTTLSMAETASVGLQRFYIVETSAVSAPFDGTKSIRAAKDKSFSVNIASASKAEGANVSLYTYTNSNARKFNIIYSGGGYYRLVNVNSGLCLTIKDNSDADGANVIQSKWKGYSSQRWKITKNSDGTVTITNMLGTVLHLLGNRTVNNTNIHARKAASTTAQKWYLN